MKLLWRYTLPLLILWLAFSLRLYHLAFQSIWWDEGHSIFVALQPISQIPTLPAMDVHPPAYFILLHLWLALTGQSEFALRYLSVIFSLLTIALLWRFASALSPFLASPSHRSLVSPAPLLPCSPAPRLLAALFAALSPMYVAYAQEVRGYAMITFLALASTYMLWRIFFTSKDSAVGGPKGRLRTRRSAVIFYVFLTAACLYSHYFTIFLLLFHNLAWLVWTLRENKHRMARLATWITSQAGIILLFTPQLFLALRQVTSYTNPNLSPPSLTEFILRSWQAYTVGLTLNPNLARWETALIAGVFAVILLLWLLQILTPSIKSPIPNPQSPTPNPQSPSSSSSPGSSSPWPPTSSFSNANPPLNPATSSSSPPPSSCYWPWAWIMD